MSLPTLAESDAFVRDAAKGLSTHPQLGAWLAARGLVRTLTVSVQNIGEGRSPALFLPFLTPTVRFQAVQKGSLLVADPKSYAAYDDFADGVAALDAAECARVYGILAPLFAAAYADLGYPGPDFPKAVARAVAVLAATPVADTEVALRRGPSFFEFADPKLEGLSLAQKHLLRMGPATPASSRRRPPRWRRPSACPLIRSAGPPSDPRASPGSREGSRRGGPRSAGPRSRAPG